ncbi:hypothetical protein Bca4012_021466 [Brassica carinata]
MSRRYGPPYYSPPRRGCGDRARSPPPPRRGYGGGGRKGSSSGSLLVRNIPLDCREPRGFAFVEFVDAYDAGEAQRSMNKRVFAGREITVVVASESRKKPEEMRVKTRTRSSRLNFSGNLLALEVVLMDGLVHVQSLDHALHVVHQTLEADADQGLILLHQDEEEQSIQHLQGEDTRNVHGHHQEVPLLEEKKMENTVAGPIPLVMKVVLLQTRTEMETMRLERNLGMNQRKGIVGEEQFQGRHLDPGLDLRRHLQDET